MEEAPGPALPFDDLLAEAGEERGREIALGEGRNDDDDGLAGIFLPLAKLDGRGQRGTRGNADRHTFKTRNETGMLESLVIADGNHLVIDMGVENGGAKPAPMPWILCGPDFRLTEPDCRSARRPRP